MFIWTFSDIVFFALMCIIVCFIVYKIINHTIHKLFYKNCKNCKHCKLMNVASCGDGADYRCDLDKTYKKLNKKMVKFHEPIFKRCKNFK